MAGSARRLPVYYSIASRPGPARTTPPRRPGSVRRTTTHDSVRGDGIGGPVTVTARGRDLLTAADGTTRVLGATRVDALVAYPDTEILSIELTPADDRVRALTGARATAGFRGKVNEAMPGLRDSGEVRFQLLDDLPTALLVSGYAVLAASRRAPDEEDRPRKRHSLQAADMCSGWVSGGVLMSGMDAVGRPPHFIGPIAPPVETPATPLAQHAEARSTGRPDGPPAGHADDPLGWHETAPLRPHGMRRRRRIDVWLSDGAAHVEAFFRDSHFGPDDPENSGSPDATERVIHEYTVRATVDPATRTFTDCRAEFGALPWPECPGALASAGRLAGAPVAGLRKRVRADFTGLGTCTHLNDTLRALEDIGALLDALDGTGPHQVRW